MTRGTDLTYRPLDPNHPSTPNHFAILPHSPEGVPRVLKSQLETVGYLRMRRGVRRLTCE